MDKNKIDEHVKNIDEKRANNFARTDELAVKRIHVDDLVKNRAEIKINDDGSINLKILE